MFKHIYGNGFSCLFTHFLFSHGCCGNCQGIFWEFSTHLLHYHLSNTERKFVLPLKNNFLSWMNYFICYDLCICCGSYTTPQKLMNFLGNEFTKQHQKSPGYKYYCIRINNNQ